MDILRTFIQGPSSKWEKDEENNEWFNYIEDCVKILYNCNKRMRKRRCKKCPNHPTCLINNVTVSPWDLFIHMHMFNKESKYTVQNELLPHFYGIK